MPPLLGLGAAIGGLGALAKIPFGIHQNHLANKINPVFNQYKTNPYASQQLGLARSLFNSRMFGASQQERNIQANQANFIGNVGRNATDSSQALALAAAGQGQTNEAYSDLQLKESQNKYAMLGNLNNAYGNLVNEGDKEYNSMLQKYQIDVGQKNALRQAGANNIFGGMSDLAGLGIQLGQLGQQDKYNKQLLDLLKIK